MKKLLVVLVLAMFMGVVSCGVDTSNGEWKKVSGDDITLEGTLEEPTINWSGEAVNLYVADENADIMWQIGESQYVDVQTFTGPVRYGEVPAGVHEMLPPEELEAGKTYQIFINLNDASHLSAFFKFE